MTAVFLATATLVSTAGSAFADPQSTSSAKQGLRNDRYCEVIPSVQDGSTVTSYIYNTLGFNHCPPGKWNKLTEAEVTRSSGLRKPS